MKPPPRKLYERFAIPYDFKPQLGFREAVILALLAFTRIFLGSILFGFVGGYALHLQGSFHHPAARAAILLAGLILFATLLTLLLISISSLSRVLLGKRL